MPVETTYKLVVKPVPKLNKVQAITGHWKGLHPLFSNILVQRGYEEFEDIIRFLNPSAESLADFGEMKGQKIAVERLKKAILEGDRILLYGDYDVDGTCSVAMMKLAIELLGGKVETYIPDRFIEGYGVSEIGADRAMQSGISLMITLDCGIRATEHLKRVSDAGIDVIICDHHIPGNDLPEVYAILNPMQVDCPFQGKELCGCGVAFILLRNLCNELGESTVWKSMLDFVAVATCADIVPLIGINRILVAEGLKILLTTPHLGFSSLLRLGKEITNLSVGEIVFRIAPRINAAGRLAHGSLAVELLTVQDPVLADILVAKIETLNLERRKLDQQITIAALEQASLAYPESSQSVTVLSHPDWQKGVVGIVASRVMEHHYRPTIILAESEGYCTGSARSVPGVNIYEMLNACASHLERYGGHAAAAGLTVKRESLGDFTQAIEAIIGQQMPEGGFKKDLEIDVILNLDEWYNGNQWKLIDQLAKLEPCGPQNMQPVFLTENCLGQWAQIRGQDHLSFTVYQSGSHIKIPLIAFKMANYYDRIVAGHSFDLAYTIGINEWQNEKTIQLEAKAILFHE